MIPKTIHYCWFNDSPIPQRLKVCMESWKKVLPDYKWRKWGVNDFDINSLLWTKEAYGVGALAFVADYVRLYALYTEGGIYMDTDVLMKKSFDPFLSDGFFTAIEYHPETIEADRLAQKRLDTDGTNRFPNTPVPGLALLSAVLGAEKGHPFLKSAMEFYHHQHFILEDGNWNIEKIAPDVLALAAEPYGLKYNKDTVQLLDKRIRIYTPSILGAAYTQVTKDTVAVHLCTGSWRKRSLLRTILSKINFYRKIFKAK